MDGGPSTRRTALLALTAALVGALALAACTRDEPVPTPSTSSASPSVATSPSPSPTPPVAPAAEPTPKSAEAFVKYFWAVQNYSYASLDTAPLAAISGTDCKFCQNTRQDVEGLRDAGTRSEGSLVRLVEAAAPPGKITSGVIVATVISQDPGRLIRQDGTTRSLPGVEKERAYVGLVWIRSGWLIDDVAIEKAGEKS